jgi:hypothetical protein
MWEGPVNTFHTFLHDFIPLQSTPPHFCKQGEPDNRARIPFEGVI